MTANSPNLDHGWRCVNWYSPIYVTISDSGRYHPRFNFLFQIKPIQNIWKAPFCRGCPEPPKIMFYSTDLLSFRGGKFSTIWLLGTCRDKKQTANKKRQELKKLKLHRICEELTKLLPVQGKERSLSLRLSASLLYGTCLAYRFQADYLHRTGSMKN